ncbi:MAG: TniQ family protein [Promethearchaeota archaeon]
MNTIDVLSLLEITREELHRYREKGALKAVKNPNGTWEWDEDSVHSLLNHFSILLEREFELEEYVGVPKFSLIPKPQTDELLSSWLVRVALANYATLSEFLKSINNVDTELIQIPLKTASWWNYDFDRKCNKLLRAILMRNLGITRQKIVDMTIEDFEKNLFHLFIVGYMHSKWGGLRYCPRCFEEEPAYFRRSWKLKFITCCPEHNILLRNKCPTCKEPLSIRKLLPPKSIKQCWNCGSDLSSCSTIILGEHDAYKHIILLLEEFLKFKKFTLNGVDYFNVSSFFKHFHRNCLDMFNFHYPYHKTTREEIAFYSESAFWKEHSDIILKEAFDLLEKKYFYLESIPVSHYLFEYSFFKTIKREFFY